MKSQRSAHPTAGRGGPPWLLVGAVLVLLGALGLWPTWTRTSEPLVAVDASAPGRLEAAQPVVDLGRVPFDRVAEAHFELANTGGSVVRVTGKPQVRTLEGC